MVAVLIHPSGIGNAVGAKNWRNTIESTVDYRRGALAAALTAAERRTLEELHPGGNAPFWGAHRFHSARMAALAPGDVVVFTGKKRVLAVGRIGPLTDNASLGDVLWQPHPTHKSYRFVYSLAPIEFIEMPQTEFRARGGFGEADDFRSLRVLTGPRADGFVAEFADVVPGARAVVSPVESGLAFVHDASSAAVTGDMSRTRAADVRTGGDDSGQELPEHASGGPSETEHTLEARSAWDELGRDLLVGAGDEDEVLARLAGFVGSTDAASAVRALRREQGLLRESLGIGASRGDVPAQCGLCGRHFPRGSPRRRAREAEECVHGAGTARHAACRHGGMPSRLRRALRSRSRCGGRRRSHPRRAARAEAVSPP